MQTDAIGSLVLKDAWFIACESASLGARPFPLTVQSTPLVLFRDENGTASALVDRCPHRNAPLSAGRVRKGTLECAYHGWRFDGQGTCRAVPGLCSDDVSLKARNAEMRACRELDGYVYVASSPGVPSTDPFRFPHLKDPSFTSVRKDFVVKASLHTALENVLDVPHTAFLHGGLFRTEEKKNTIDVVVRKHGTFVEAEYLGEPRPEGLAGRLLAPQGGVVVHFDRFLLPSVAQVEYRLGEKSTLFSTSAMTPISAYETHIWACVTYRLPVPHAVVRPFVEPIVRKIFEQDRALLERITETVRLFGGERYTSTEIDVLGAQILRLLTQASKGEAPREGVEEFRLKMRT